MHAKQEIWMAILALTVIFIVFSTSFPKATGQATQMISTSATVIIDPTTAGRNDIVRITLKVSPLPPSSNDSFHNFQYILTRPDGTTQSAGPFIANADGEYAFDFIPTELGNYTFAFSYPGETFSSTNVAYQQAKASGTLSVLVIANVNPLLFITFSVFFSILIEMLILLFIVKIVKKSWNIADLIRDRDYWPSLANFQILLWSILIGFCFLTIIWLRLLSGVLVLAPIWPVNLLALLGISAAVVPTSYFLSRNKYPDEVPKKDAQNATPAPAPATAVRFQLSQNQIDELKQKRTLQSILMENNEINITRFQMFAWTIIAVVTYGLIFSFNLAKFAGTGPASFDAISALLVLPDIDLTLVALMGISQGAYLSGKAVTDKTTLIYEGISSNSVREGDTITIHGANLGNEKGAVQIGDRILDANNIVTWGDSLVVVKIPKIKDLTEQPTTDRKYKVKLVICGKTLELSDPITIKQGKPTIESVPKEAIPGQKVAITGDNFGTSGQLLLNNFVIDGILPQDWENTRISFRVPKLNSGEYQVNVNNTVGPDKIRIVEATPIIFPNISPNPAIEESNITIFGNNFGQEGGLIIGGTTIEPKNITWTDSKITAKVPKIRELLDKPTDQRARVFLTIGKTNYEAPSLKIEYAIATIDSVPQRKLSANEKIAIRGHNFGETPGTLLIDDTPTNVEKWSRTMIIFTVPKNLAPGEHEVALEVNGMCVGGKKIKIA